jgi:hypothetical protein
MAASEELLHGELCNSQFGIKGRIHPMPEIGQQAGRQIFCAGHRRKCEDHLLRLTVSWYWHRRLGVILANSG